MNSKYSKLNITTSDIKTKLLQKQKQLAIDSIKKEFTKITT